jgi:hypothetical protein
MNLTHLNFKCANAALTEYDLTVIMTLRKSVLPNRKAAHKTAWQTNNLHSEGSVKYPIYIGYFF